MTAATHAAMRSAPVILLVEDNEADAFSFGLATQRTGFAVRVETVRTAREAVDYVSGFGVYSDRLRYPPPKLIVTDTHTPGLSGLELLDWLRADPRSKAIPVVLFGNALPADTVKQAYELGIASCVFKPSASDDLVRVLNALFSYWFLCETPLNESAR
jgi:CheY-like chemotaxis protein